MKYILSLLSLTLLAMNTLGLTVQAGSTVSGEKRTVVTSKPQVKPQSKSSSRALLASFTRMQREVKAKILSLNKQITELQKKIDDKVKRGLSVTLYTKQIQNLTNNYEKAIKKADYIQKKIDTASGSIKK